MKLTLSPQSRSDALEVHKAGDKITVNGEEFDFTQLPEGAFLPASAVDCEFIIGDVSRQDGELHLTLLLPISADAGHEACFPEPIVNPEDGLIKLPGAGNEEISARAHAGR